MRLFRAFGADVDQYRRRAVDALALRPGDTVVDLGCGTGLNFPHLQRAVGPSGHVIGVDLTDAMLDQARIRVARHSWTNVALVEADAAEYAFPASAAGILSTFAITMVDEYDEVIARAARALPPGGRLVLFEMRRPERWPEWLIRFGSWLNRPFGVSRDYADRAPWQSVRRHFDEVTYEEFYGGALYLCAGERRARS